MPLITLVIYPSYRTLVERMLSMRLVYARRVMNRQISFEFLNRQLIWHTFTVRDITDLSAFDHNRAQL